MSRYRSKFYSSTINFAIKWPLQVQNGQILKNHFHKIDKRSTYGHVALSPGKILKMAPPFLKHATSLLPPSVALCN